MNRRDFFSRFLGAGALTMGNMVPSPTNNPVPDPDQIPVGPYLLHWTGWKQVHDQDRIIAQWLAWPAYPDLLVQYPVYQRYFYVCAPRGEIGAYRPGDSFNTALLRGHEIIHAETPEWKKRLVKDHTLQDLKAHLREYGIRSVVRIL